MFHNWFQNSTHGWWNWVLYHVMSPASPRDEISKFHSMLNDLDMIRFCQDFVAAVDFNVHLYATKLHSDAASRNSYLNLLNEHEIKHRPQTF